MKILTPITLSLVVVACGGPSPDSADAVFLNGRIYTVDVTNPWVTSVAVRDGQYVALGEGVSALIGPETEVIDLEGKMAMPGINDAHIHPIMAGVKLLYECTFPFTAGPEQIREALTACAAEQPDAAWIRGGQWSSAFFDLHDVGNPRQFLDEISDNHAIFLNDDSGHNGWVNSKALALAGIDGSTEDPEGGTIVRGEDGVPNGVLLETAARLFDVVIPPLSEAQLVDAAAESIKTVNAYGITGFKDAGAFETAAIPFNALDQAGRLTLHAAACVPTPYGHRTEALDYEAIETVRREYASDNVHTNFVKIFLDGVPTPARTAAMIQPYLPDEAHGSAFTGKLHLDPELLKNDVIELDRRGFTVKMHAAGDRAVRIGLDAIEAARKANGDTGLRHELAHAGYIDPADMPRFAELNAVADFSPYLWHPSPIIAAVISAVGKRRGTLYWPTKTLLSSGAQVAIGSDWPAAVPDANPWVGMEALVTRMDPRQQTDGELWPEEAVTLEQAIGIYTLSGAKALGLDDVTGSIAVGKFADLIVLDRNLFEGPIDDVGDTRVLMTYFKGEQVYAAR